MSLNSCLDATVRTERHEVVWDHYGGKAGARAAWVGRIACDQCKVDVVSKEVAVGGRKQESAHRSCGELIGEVSGYLLGSRHLAEIHAVSTCLR